MPPGRPKGSTGINKSEMVREYLRSNPAAGTNEVIDALGQKGIEVSQALVSGVRKREERGPGNKSRGAITVDELATINSLIERFDDRSVIVGLIDELSKIIRGIGGMERFDEAMRAFNSWKPSDSISASETDSSDSDSDSDDDSDDDDDEDEDD